MKKPKILQNGRTVKNFRFSKEKLFKTIDSIFSKKFSNFSKFHKKIPENFKFSWIFTTFFRYFFLI